MASQKTSLRKLISNRDEDLLLDRSTELKLFKQALDSRENHAHFLSFYGIGGVGKSKLLDAFKKIALSSGALVGFLSAENSSTPKSILVECSAQLNNSDESNDAFSKFFSTLSRLEKIEKRLREEINKENETFNKVAVEAVKAGVASSAGVVIGSAIAGPPGAIIGGTIGGALGPFIEKANLTFSKTVSPKELSKKDSEFRNDAENILTSNFVDAIKHLASNGNKIVLLFDTLEYLGNTIDWLFDELFNKLSNTELVVIIAGRYPVPFVEVKQLKSRLDQYELQPFSKSTTVEYLSHFQIADPQTTEYIYQQTAGLPLAVALWTLFPPKVGENKNELPIDFFKESSQVKETVIDTLLDRLPNDGLREVFYAASIPRWFNPELLSRLLEKTNAEIEYDELSNLDSVIRIRPRGLSIHDILRKFIIESFSLRNPLKYTQFHQTARDYFHDLCLHIEAEGGRYNDDWKSYSREWIYHSLLLGDIDNFAQEIERSSRYYQHFFAKEIIADVETYQNLIQSSNYVFEYHRGQNLIHFNDFTSAIKVFCSLLASRYIENVELVTLTYYQLGKAYFWIGDFSNASEQLAKAYSIFQQQKNVRMQSHAANFLSRIEEINGSIKQAIVWRSFVIKNLRVLLRAEKGTPLYFRDLGDKLFSQAEILRLKNQYSEAIEIYHQCLEKRKSLQNDFDVGETYIALAKCFIANKKQSESKVYLTMASQIYLKTDDAYMLADIHLLIARCFFEEDNFLSAKKEAQLAINLATESQHNFCLLNATKFLNKLAEDMDVVDQTKE